MQRLYVSLTNKEYEMTRLDNRLQMRYDLNEIGFFEEEDNRKFWLILSEDSPAKEEVRQFMNSIKLYEIKVTNRRATEQN